MIRGTHGVFAAGFRAESIPTDGLIAWFTMDNISGSTLYDEQGTYDGAITGATSVSGRFDNALSFSANSSSTSARPVSAYVEHDLITFTGDFTLSLWSDIDYGLKVRGCWLGGDDAAAGGSAVGGASAFYYLNSNTSIYVIAGDSLTVTDIGSLSSGWRHLILARSGSTVYVYVDTTEVASFTETNDFEIEFLGTYRTTNSSVHSRWKQDQHRYYNRYLSSDERTQLYNESTS